MKHLRGVGLALLLVAVAASARAQTPPQNPPQLPPQTTDSASAACQAPAGASTTLQGNGVQAWWQAEPAPLKVGQAFALLITMCPTRAELLKVDAQMPAHRHGMNYRASVQALGGGRWRAEGLLWHMPGRWDLALDVRVDGQAQRLEQAVQLR